MSNVLDHREKCIKELESILVASGWQDSWGIFPSGNGRDYSKPLFFKDNSPIIDDKFEVEILGVKKMLYALYSVTSMNTMTVSNSANCSSVNVGFTIYSSDKYESYDIDYDIDSETATADTIFNAFSTNLLANLQQKQWGISFLGEDATIATEGGEDYWYRLLFLFNKIFY